MNLYETVKASVRVPEAAERYGLDVGRSGMMRCVFHDDRHPSMKLNEDYFYTCGCIYGRPIENVNGFSIGLRGRRSGRNTQGSQKVRGLFGRGGAAE